MTIAHCDLLGIIIKINPPSHYILSVSFIALLCDPIF